MGILDVFKKKNDFNEIIKDPLTDPLAETPGNLPKQGELPNSEFQMPQQDNFNSFDSKLGSINDETALGHDFALNSNHNNTSAQAIEFQNNKYDENKYAGSSEFRTQDVHYQEKNQNDSSINIDNRNIDKRDIELITAKLDNIKTQLENINQRLENFERKAYDDTSQRKKYYRW